MQGPVTYGYPGLTRGNLSAYLAAFGLVLGFFLLFVAGTEGLWFEKLAFLVLGTAVITPFLLRDYRKSHRKLTLGRDGLGQTNGGEIFISWDSISAVLVKESNGLGYGTVLVKGRAGQRIIIPRSLPNIGQICYLLKVRSGVAQTYGHEY